MGILLWFIILIVSLAVLIKASDYFTDYSEKLGLSFGLSAFIIGATIVSIGTSMPELVTAIISMMSPDKALAAFPIDNVIGSNIANALLVIGIAAVVVKKLKVKKVLIDIDLPFFFISTALFVLFIMDGSFNWKEGIVSLILFVTFILYTSKHTEHVDEAFEQEKKDVKRRDGESRLKLITMIAISAFFIFLGGKYTVDSVLNLSQLLGWSSSALTLLIVALGTSLPEIVVSVVAALKGNHAIAIGNAFGSNTFNALLVTGLPSFIAPLEVSSLSMTIGIPFLIVASFACIFATMDNQVRFWEGCALLVLYIAFVGTVTGII